MTTIRDFFWNFLGGSQMMWDVALGVVIGGIFLALLYIVLVIVMN